VLSSRPPPFTPLPRSERAGSQAGRRSSRTAPRTPSAAAPPPDWRCAVTDEDLAYLHSSFSGGGEAWEEVLSRESPELGLSYCAHRRAAPPEAGGGSVWRSSTRFSGVPAERLAAFQLDAARRHEWDSGVALFADLTEAAGEAPEGLSLHFWRMRFPAPLAPRDYVTARRTWREGETLFVVSRALRGPPPPAVAAALPGGRAHRVGSYYAGLRVAGCEGGARLDTLYYEDSGIKPSVVDWTVKRGLWGFVEKQAAGLKAFQPAPAGAAPAAPQPPPRRQRPRLRDALRGAGGFALSLAGAGARGLAAALASSPSPSQRQARREKARAAASRVPSPLAPLAALSSAVRSRVHPVESLQRRGAAALGAAKQHLHRERERREARERERRRREALISAGLGLRADARVLPRFDASLAIGVAAAVAVRLLRRAKNAERA